MELNDKWIIWSHVLTDTNWDNNSYKKIFEINNIFDLKIVNDTINEDFFIHNMIFIMKDGIFPTWEDKNNCNGCCGSFKITNPILWNNVINELLILNIFKDLSKINKINGLSITSKKHFYILKIWFIDNINDISPIIKDIHPLISKRNCRLRKNIN